MAPATDDVSSSSSSSAITKNLSANYSSLDEASSSSKKPPSTVITLERMGTSKSVDTNAPHDEDEEVETLPSLEHVIVEDQRGVPPKRRLDAPRRYFRYALTLWILEILSVIMLKHVGLLEKEFRLDTVVTQTVLPRINESLPIGHLTQEKKRPGFLLAQQGAEANYPVVMIPGFVTSGLEVWLGRDCAKGFFRQRLWAALTGARSFLLERDCWREHMMLDPFTGGDPEGIKVRASQGFEAADYFLVSYWVWAKLIENLADVGYTPTTMTMEPYDWRLSFPMLEKRDGYLTKLKAKVEAIHKTTGKKIVLTSHSMGANLVHYFFAWVTASEKSGGGGGGKNWVNDHVHAYINIAGAHLGVPKAATALLSGEMSDTVLTGMIKNMAEQFFGRRRRRDLWNTWGSLWSMLPKGGSGIWGVGADLGCTDEEAQGEDDPFCLENRLSPLLKMQVDGGDEEKDSVVQEGPSKLVKDFTSKESMSVETVLGFLRDYGAGLGRRTAATRDMSLFGEERHSSRIWHDPTRTPLPRAPEMTIYCLYGVGVDTERAYFYRKKEESPDGEANDEFDPPVVLDSDVHDSLHQTEFGIRYGDGDGSVPLVSLGYMCSDAWRKPESGLNPSRSKIITREYQHQPGFCVEDPIRGGPGSADHVDILGNINMMEDFVKIVTGFDEPEVAQDQIVSDITGIAKRINSHPMGGIKRPNRNWIEWIHR